MARNRRLLRVMHRDGGEPRLSPSFRDHFHNLIEMAADNQLRSVGVLIGNRRYQLAMGFEAS